MSTYLYLKCLDHDPPLLAEAESGQHLYDLAQIREDIACRAALVGVKRWDLGYFRAHTARFLNQHQGCRIGIEDEYGRDYTEDAP